MGSDAFRGRGSSARSLLSALQGLGSTVPGLGFTTPGLALVFFSRYPLPAIAPGLSALASAFLLAALHQLPLQVLVLPPRRLLPAFLLQLSFQVLVFSLRCFLPTSLASVVSI